MNLSSALAIAAERNKLAALRVKNIATSSSRRLLVLTHDDYYVVNYDDVTAEVEDCLKLIAKAMLDNYNTETEIFVKINKDLMRLEVEN